MDIKTVKDFYEQALLPLSPRAELVPLLKAVFHCGETTRDFVWALRNDLELQSWLRSTVGATGVDTHKQGLEQVIAVIGQDKVRDILLGRSIERAFVKSEDSIYGKHSKGAKKPTSSDSQDTEAPPPIAEFSTYLVFSKKAEEVANTIRFSYPWQAYIGGLFFDYLSAHIKSKKVDTIPEIKRTDIRAYKALVENAFSMGLRSAIAATEVLQKITIKHQKSVFVAALVQEAGSLIQFGFDPLAYEKFLNEFEQRKSVVRLADSHLVERKYFCFDSNQMNSLFLGRFNFLQDVDRVVDYASSPKILRMRDSNLYALHAVLYIGSRLSKLYQEQRGSQSDIHKIDDSQIRLSEEFNFLKLSSDEWKSIKSSFAVKLMKASL